MDNIQADQGNTSGADVVILREDILKAVEVWRSANGIDKFNQGNFNACMIDICNRYIKGIYSYTQGNSYSYDDLKKINDILDIYIILCMFYNRRCDIYGFSLFCGIPFDTLYRWRDDSKASPLHKQIIKKILITDENILTGRAADGCGNVIGCIFLLKNLHDYTDERRLVHETGGQIAKLDDIRLALGVND